MISNRAHGWWNSARDALDAGVHRITAANSAFHQAVVHGSAHRRLSALLVHAVDIPLVYQVFRHQTLAESERSKMAEHIMQGRDCVLALRSQTCPEAHIHAS